EQLDVQRQIRRWPRKHVAGSVVANVDHREARLLDISYGGLCLEFAEAFSPQPLPSTMNVHVPHSGLSLHIHPVWAKTASASRKWQCGGEVIANDQLAVWQRFVDSIPEPSGRIAET